jgi:hypothetical protein
MASSSSDEFGIDGSSGDENDPPSKPVVQTEVDEFLNWKEPKPSDPGRCEKRKDRLAALRKTFNFCIVIYKIDKQVHITRMGLLEINETGTLVAEYKEGRRSIKYEIKRMPYLHECGDGELQFAPFNHNKTV